MYSVFPVRKRVFLPFIHMQWMGVGCCLRFFCYLSIQLTVTVPVLTLMVNRSFTVPLQTLLVAWLQRITNVILTCHSFNKLVVILKVSFSHSHFLVQGH
jgi:hypothetical protein